MVGTLKSYVAALGLLGATSSVVIAEPLKIAVVDSLSGAAASTSAIYLEATRYAVREINAAGGFKGEPIQLVEYDNQSNVAVASDKLKSAIQDGAKIIIQVSLSSIAAQLSEDVRKYNTRNPGKEVILVTAGEAAELTGKRCAFYQFRMASTAPAQQKSLIEFMKSSGVLGDKVYLVNQNYSYGQESLAAQKEYVEAAGAAIVGTDLHDVMKLQDFSPFASKIVASGAKTLLTANWGSDLVLLLRAINDTHAKIQVGGPSIDLPGTLPAAGVAAEGAYLVKIYNIEAGGETGAAFNEAYKKETGHYPRPSSAQMYFSWKLMQAGLKLLEGKEGGISAKDIALAFEKAQYQTPGGTWSVRADDHQLLAPLYVSEVSKDAKYKHDDTEYGFKLLGTIDPATAAAPVSAECKMERPS